VNETPASRTESIVKEVFTALSFILFNEESTRNVIVLLAANDDGYGVRKQL
jgi:hypothetical protein